MTEPCGWTIDKCGCSSDGACWNDLSPTVRARASALAIHTMWAATGRRYGLCQQTVMPCTPPTAIPLYETYPLGPGGGSGYNPFDPGSRVSLIDGQWSNNGCGGACGCAAPCAVELPGPVDSIIDVRIAGVSVQVGTYNVLGRHLLVRLGGLCWPTCQTYDQQIPGFQVTYLRGDPIPAAVQAGAETLTCEYAAACTGGECRLPGRLASLSRSGVDLSVAEPFAGSDRAGNKDFRIRTGIQEVDDIITADNPYGLAERREVFSPDLPPAPQTVTWTGGS